MFTSFIGSGVRSTCDHILPSQCKRDSGLFILLTTVTRLKAVLAHSSSGKLHNSDQDHQKATDYFRVHRSLKLGPKNVSLSVLFNLDCLQ